MTPEKRVQNSIVQYLKSLADSGLKVYYERRQAGGFSYKKGIADLYAIINGVHLEIEVKRPGGSLSVMQEKWKDKCDALGICWLCAESVEDVKFYLTNNFII